MTRWTVAVLSCAIASTATSQVPAAPDTASAPSPVFPRAERVLQFDFPGLLIGVAEYEAGPTGATVFRFPNGATVAVDVRGGAAATINTDLLRNAYTTRFIDAISFAGGSSYGLAAATGAADAIKESRGGTPEWGRIATVAGAIVFDFGGRRFNMITPDYALGRAALSAAVPGRFPLGAHGAGRFTTQGGFYGDTARQHSGQGGAFRQVGATKIAVFTVVNSLGAVIDREGRIARCGRMTAACGTIGERVASHVAAVDRRAAAARDSAGPSRNTTLTLVVTNQRMPFWALQRLAIQVHTSMGRAIHPFATERDGDVLFAATTGELDNPALSFDDLGVIASEVAWDAVLSSVPTLRPSAPPAVAIDRRRLDDYAGSYAFVPRAVFTVRRDGDGLIAESTDGAGIYVLRTRPVRLIPVGRDEFVFDNPRGDHVRFTRDAAGRVTGVVMNPEGWPVHATRSR